MSDSPRPDPSREIDAASDADRDAKIEQLLLAGLDHYFAARYDQAINVWTRALFFDRGHARARAYIERARRALAERQREVEELLHTGAAALDRGDGGEARRLLQAAIDSGAGADELHPLIARLSRDTDAGSIPASVQTSTASPRTSLRARVTLPQARRAGIGPGFALLTIVLVAGVLAGAYALAVRDGLDLRSSLSFQDSPAGAAAAPTARETSLPLPRRGELAMERARSLAAGGRVHQALAVLESVRSTDPQNAEADRLRTDLQRQLLGLVTIPPAPAAEPNRGTGAGSGSDRLPSPRQP